MADKTAEQQPALLANDTNIAASQLSALVDEELPAIESNLVMLRLYRDPEVRDRWERYHLISDVLQDHLPTVIDTDFAARIRHVIEADPLPLPVSKSLPSWYKPVTGFSLAASVVLMTLLGLKLTQTGVTQPPTQFATTNPSFTPSAFLPVQKASLGPRINPDYDANSIAKQSLLDGYLVNHNGYASMNSIHGVLPHVRMVGYQADQ